MVEFRPPGRCRIAFAGHKTTVRKNRIDGKRKTFAAQIEKLNKNRSRRPGGIVTDRWVIRRFPFLPPPPNPLARRRARSMPAKSVRETANTTNDLCGPQPARMQQRYCAPCICKPLCVYCTHKLRRPTVYRTRRVPGYAAPTGTRGMNGDTRRAHNRCKPNGDKLFIARARASLVNYKRSYGYYASF